MIRRVKYQPGLPLNASRPKFSPSVQLSQGGATWINRRNFLFFGVGFGLAAVGSRFMQSPENTVTLEKFFHSLSQRSPKPKVMVAYPAWVEFPGPGNPTGAKPSADVLRKELGAGVDATKAAAIARTLEIISLCEKFGLDVEVRRHTTKAQTISSSILYRKADWNVVVFTMPNPNDAQRQEMLEVQRLLIAERSQSGNSNPAPVESFIVDHYCHPLKP